MILNNKEVTVSRYTTTAGKTTYTDVVGTTLGVYIQPLSDDVLVGSDGMSAYEGFLLMTDFLDIQVGDKINDGEFTYKVKGVKKFETIIDIHIEAVIQKDYAN